MLEATDVDYQQRHDGQKEDHSDRGSAGQVGRRQLPHFALLESAYRRRQEQRTPLERAFLRLTGLEMKMRQYVLGERFCREVRDAGGQQLLARVWEGPALLPTMAEIQRPQLFIERARTR